MGVKGNLATCSLCGWRFDGQTQIAAQIEFDAHMVRHVERERDRHAPQLTVEDKRMLAGMSILPPEEWE